MKIRILFTLLLITYNFFAYAQALKVGDNLPNYQLKSVVSYKADSLNFKDTKGKILIIEFWGTWCSPCIPALQHLDELRNKFPDDVFVVGISDDSKERLTKFLTKRVVSIPLASEKDMKLNGIFAFNMVPHTIIADKNGKIIAITSPNEVTEEKIKEIIAGKKPDFKLKEEKEFDSKIDYFGADESTDYSVIQKAFIQGFPSFSTRGKGGFKDRRISCINLSPSSILQLAFKKSFESTIVNLPKERQTYTPENLYCFDIIVKNSEKENLHKIMQTEATKLFDIKANIEKRLVDVYVLKKVADILKESTKKETNGGSSGRGIKAEYVEMDFLVSFLANELQKPVVDETSLKGKYDINFEFASEDPTSLKKVLESLGLKISKEKREVEMLIVSE
jgi:uncharacterized protein (TIGR03435 family)